MILCCRGTDSRQQLRFCWGTRFAADEGYPATAVEGQGEPVGTRYESGYQLKLPMETEIFIAKDAPVRLLNAIVERMNISKILRSYSRLGRIEYSPRILLKILLYAYVRGIYSSRKIEQACRENIHFMYLLEGHRVPDHNAICRFRSKHLAGQEDDLLAQMTSLLRKWGFVSLEAVFIDGTKIEANANRYSFVWKKSTEKNRAKLLEKIREQLPALLDKAEVKWRMPEAIEVRHLKKLEKRLKQKRKDEGIVFVYGKGHRRSALQKASEAVREWTKKLKEYGQKLHICGERNSFSKTDHDATFMHMKEDHMKNGQLKPGYNVNVATSEEFIVGNYISADRNDVHTFIPFMEKLKGNPIGAVVVDSGYESEENYYYAETLEDTELYVKPANHEQRKKKKYQTDISRRENMKYDKETDTYTCAAGKSLIFDKNKKSRTRSGFEITTSVYSCKSCKDCPLKSKCIRSASKKPLEERRKVLYVSRRFAQQREAMEEKINTERGKLLRVNRSIQAEGVFAMTKEDMDFRRFLLRGTVKVAVEWVLLSLAYNILKLHHKLQDGRLGTGLVIPESFPAGL